MEELERSEFTRAGEMANERFIEAAVDGERYPDQTAVIAADASDFAEALANSVAENRPVAIVYPNGFEVVATPTAGTLALIGAALLKRGLPRLSRRQPGLPAEVDLPPQYHVEFRRPERLAIG